MPTYFYDAGGRLYAVMDATGRTSTYAYDLAGNILSITQNPSSTALVLQVCPNQAPAGSAVTIWGSGFSSPASVSFHGTAATNVTVVSANKIVATVPSGATSGTVSVTPNGGSKVSSPSVFNIGLVPPQVTGISGGTTVSGLPAFNPFPFYSAASGADATGALTGSLAGTQSMTISGSGFDTTTPLASTKNKVWIGSAAATVTSASAGSLTVQVPVGGSVIKNGAVPGVTVTTPSGTATYSAKTLFLAPAGVGPYLINLKSPSGTTSVNLCGVDTSEVDAVSDKLAVGGNVSLSFAAGSTTCAGQTATSLHYVAYVFSGTAGSMINAQVSICPSGGGSCGPGQTSGYTGNAVLLVAPDGSEVDAADLGGSYPPQSSGATQEFWQLPQTGTYTIFVQNLSSGGANTSQVALNRISAPQNLGTTSIGSSISGTIAPFQAASFTFSVPSGSNGRATLLTKLASPAGSPFAVSVTAPDGFTQVYSNVAPQEGDSQGFLSPGQVDFSGPIAVPAITAGTTYTVKYQSLGSGSSSVTFTLAQLPGDVASSCTGSLPASGATSGTTVTCNPAAISSPGQGVSANFGASAVFTNNTGSGGNFIGALQTSASGFSGCYEVLLTDTALQEQFYRSVQCGSGDFSYALQFPSGSVGPYVAQAFGLGQNTGTLQFALSAAPRLKDKPTSINPSGPTTATLSFPGQAEQFFFSGSAGASVQLSTTGGSGWSQCYAVAAHAKGNPVSQAIASYLSCPTGPTGTLGVLQLPPATGGTYDVLLTPAGSQTGTVSLSVTSATAAPAGIIPVNGDAYTVLGSTGTSYTETFSPTFGKNSYANVVTIPNIAASPVMAGMNCYEVTVAQAGTTLFDSANQTHSYQTGDNLTCSGPDVSAPPLMQPLINSSQGTVVFNLNNASQTSNGNFTQTLYNYAVNTAGTALTPAAGGPAGLVLPSTLPAQPVAATFTTTAANNFVDVYVGLDANLVPGCMVVSINDTTQNNKSVAQQTTCEPAATMGAIALPTPGDTYQVVVQPQGNYVGNVSIGVSAQ